MSRCVIAFSIVLCGCSASVDPPETTEEVVVSVIDASGDEQEIPADELFRRTSGKSPVRKVFAFDRMTGARGWIGVELLLKEPPSTARYLAVTRTLVDDEEDESASLAQ